MIPIADKDSTANDLSYSEVIEYSGGGESGPSSLRCDAEYLEDDTFSMDNDQISDSGGDLNSLYGQSSTEIHDSGAEDSGVENDIDRSEFVGQMPIIEHAENSSINIEDVLCCKDDSLGSEVNAVKDIVVRKVSIQKKHKKTKPKKKVQQLSAAVIKKASFLKYNLGETDDDNDDDN